MALADFSRVYAVDFEFSAASGERPVPICLVAKEFRTGDTIHLWGDDLCRRTEAPYSTDSDTLFVAYYASAEVGCHDVLRWPLPARVLDLFAEFRNVTNGLPTPCGSGLVGALASFGLLGIDAAEESLRGRSETERLGQHRLEPDPGRLERGRRRVREVVTNGIDPVPLRAEP